MESTINSPSMISMNGKKAPINNGSINYKAGKQDIERLRYKKLGLWDKTRTVRFFVPKVESHVSHSIGNLHDTEEYFEAKCVPLNYFAESEKNKSFSIIKLDIEGAEFAVIRDLVRSRKIRPKQLLVEFHPGRSEIEKKYRIKTLFHSFMLWLIGYRIMSLDGWEFHFVYAPALK